MSETRPWHGLVSCSLPGCTGRRLRQGVILVFVA